MDSSRGRGGFLRHRRRFQRFTPDWSSLDAQPVAKVAAGIGRRPLDGCFFTLLELGTGLLLVMLLFTLSCLTGALGWAITTGVALLVATGATVLVIRRRENQDTLRFALRSSQQQAWTQTLSICGPDDRQVWVGDLKECTTLKTNVLCAVSLQMHTPHPRIATPAYADCAGLQARVPAGRVTLMPDGLHVVTQSARLALVPWPLVDVD